jgi:hypothetical protein
MAADLPGLRAPGNRMDQFCDSCRGIDRHPRHHYLGDDGSYTRKHFDCCHQAGCPDGSCGEHLAASGQAHGADLTAYLHGAAGQAVIARLNARNGGA